MTDVLVLRELAGPFAFGVALFAMLGMSITYLFAFTDYAVRGVSPLTLAELSVLLLPGMVSKTLPAAVLLAALLATARMSSDSETTALFALGASLWRLVRPVAYAGLGVSIITILLTEYVVPAATVRAHRMKFGIIEKLDSNPLHPVWFPVYDQGRLKMLVVARDSDLGRRQFRNAVFVQYEEGSRLPKAYIDAAQADLMPGTTKARLRNVRILEPGTASRRTADWIEIDLARTPLQLDAMFNILQRQQIRDPDATNMAETLKKIDDLRQQGIEGEETIRNLEMGFFNKMAFPLASLIFALVGAPLGMRHSRTSQALGFALSLVVIFAYWMLSSYMAVLGQGGAIAPWLASFGPNILGLTFAVALLIQRSR
jgi:lipopolysaccharide export system permease protein